MAISSKIIFCKNIKLDRNNNNVLTLSEADMLTLVNSNGIKVAEASDYSFIGRGDRDAIDVSLNYNTLLGCNYIAFQNTNYNNKWYFAFIDKIEYINNGVSRVHYTVDIFATWWSYWSPKACFVFREHVNDDTPYTNLVDEGLSVGEYTVNKSFDIGAFNKTTFKPVIAVTQLVTSSGVQDIPEYNSQGNVFQGVCYIVPTGNTDPSTIIRLYDSEAQAEAIKYIFMAPSELINLSGQTEYSGTYDSKAWSYKIIATNSSYYVTPEAPYNKPTTVDGYTPVNKKLLQYPYAYISVDPHDGNSFTYFYEDFHMTNSQNAYVNKYSFSVDAILSAGCSVKYVPAQYKTNVLVTNSIYSYAFTGVKYPICSWTSDVYTNWLTQQGVNLGFTTLNKNDAANMAGIGSMLLGGLLMATGVGATVGAGLLIGGAAGIFNNMQSSYAASLKPDQAKGNQNAGDIIFASGLVNPTINEMSLKREIAISIDNYFSKFGYKINKTKIPNQTGRANWNYVQIGNDEILCYQKTDVVAIPAQDLININKLYQRGITLWHSHSALGDYTLSNNITS